MRHSLHHGRRNLILFWIYNWVTNTFVVIFKKNWVLNRKSFFSYFLADFCAQSKMSKCYNFITIFLLLLFSLYSCDQFATNVMQTQLNEANFRHEIVLVCLIFKASIWGVGTNEIVNSKFFDENLILSTTFTKTKLKQRVI